MESTSPTTALSMNPPTEATAVEPAARHRSASLRSERTTDDGAGIRYDGTQPRETATSAKRHAAARGSRGRTKRDQSPCFARVAIPDGVTPMPPALMPAPL